MPKASKENCPIDFVIAWVDGNDPKWQKEKAHYSDNKNFDVRPNAYRDWGILKYWFRGVEQNASWVHRIYFVTWGHIPKWLNTNNPKLKIINHKDFIPKQYLPTFNSRAIELNLHRIKNLSEHFVYFNDDMFIVNKVKPSDFFKNGIPRDRGVLTINIPKLSWQIQKINNNNLSIINEEFDFRKTINKNLTKWFNPKYGTDNLRTLWLLPSPRFPGIKHEHMNGNYVKSTYNEVWKKYFKELDNTSSHKFRDQGTDVNQWIIKDWQIAKGNFAPQKRNCKFCDMKFRDKFDRYIDTIKNKKCKMICLNDADDLNEREYNIKKKALISAFEEIFPDKSSFEA